MQLPQGLCTDDLILSPTGCSETFLIYWETWGVAVVLFSSLLVLMAQMHL